MEEERHDSRAATRDEAHREAEARRDVLMEYEFHPGTTRSIRARNKGVRV